MVQANKRHVLSLLLLTLLMGPLLTACAARMRLPSIDESGSESGTETKSGQPPPPSVPMRTVSLNQATNARKLVAGVLEMAVELAPGSVVQIPATYEIEQIEFRTTTGALARSSTGFVGRIRIVSTPNGSLTKGAIDAYNSVSGGLYVSASIATAVQGITGQFKSIPGSAPTPDYLTLFETTGRPKFSYSAGVTKKFGPRLNNPIDPSTMLPADRLKYQSIFAEIQRVANRKIETDKSLLMIDRALADTLSQAFETSGSVPLNGAWSIAVQSTAVRHGFENVPCAEFQSEILREAYQRAGYDVAADFNVAKGNQLIWSQTAAVTRYTQALFAAGWVPYEPSKFRPPLGAIMMHGSGSSPGHTYLSGGDDGRIVVDNGSPQGRDLRATTKSTTQLMYETGVFFLPPSITPKAW